MIARRTGGLISLAALLLALSGGCSTARVYRARIGPSASRAANFVAARAPGPITAEVLARHDLDTATGLVDPRRAAERLVASGAATGDPDGPIALADLSLKAARRAEVFAPRDAPGLYLDAVESATAAMSARGDFPTKPDPLPPAEAEARKVYNDAVAGFLRLSAGSRMSLDDSWRSWLVDRGIIARVATGPQSWSPERYDHFDFADDYRVLGIRNPSREDGVGVPLIAQRQGSGEPPVGEERLYPRRLQAYPATALLRVDREPDAEGHRVVTVDLIDPMRANVVAFAGSSRPLRSDLTTPLAFYFTRLPLPRITQIGLLRPGMLEKETGLYLLHPYEPGKIPVVLVHGLWSSPDTWHQALNDLRGDPALRDRYQFWVFFYPTGDPFLYSSAKLRQSLADARETLDPNRRDPAFDQMVLVGHSMGGLLSRMMVVESGTTFWDEIATRPFGELNAGPGQRDLISRTFFFGADPSIKRVVFIATPHRGSTLSGAWIGRFSNALIRLPGMFEETQRDLVAQNDPGFFKNAKVVAPATSITQLSLKSGALEALNARPFTPGVKYHSIIAKSGAGPLESSSDLIVNYDSAHLEGAESELVVGGTHACLDKEATIAELRRILTLHLREIDGK